MQLHRSTDQCNRSLVMSASHFLFYLSLSLSLASFVCLCGGEAVTSSLRHIRCLGPSAKLLKREGEHAHALHARNVEALRLNL